MRVVVTGATGFLGGRLCRMLRDRGHEVVGAGRNPSAGAALERDGVRFLSIDLATRGASDRICADVEGVVHCAALSSPWGPRAAFHAANVVATRNLLDSSRAAGVRRFVHVSTPSLYASRVDRLNIREDDPLPGGRPLNHYIATKRAAEELVAGASARGLGTIILRPRGIFGPGDTALFPRLLRAQRTGRLRVIGDGCAVADLTFVDNAAHACTLALEAPAELDGETFNISNGEPVPIWGLISDLLSRLGLAPPTRSVRFDVAYGVAAALELWANTVGRGAEPPLTRYGVTVLGRSQTLDITAARERLGYAPAVSMEEGVERFVTWWKTHGA